PRTPATARPVDLSSCARIRTTREHDFHQQVRNVSFGTICSGGSHALEDMKTMMLLFALVAGCAVDASGDEQLATTEQADLNTSVIGYCYYSGGTEWCQDY